MITSKSCLHKKGENQMSHILIVEDDTAIAEIERDYLEINGFETTVESDGKKALTLLNKNHYDLVLLDVMLPGVSGFDICKKIRDELDIPLLMITAKTEAIDKIRGLSFGADDYITKPFDPAELVARVKSHLNRYERLTKKETTIQEGELNFGELIIYEKSWKVNVRGKEVKLVNKEFELLLFLAKHPNIVFSKETLFDRIWGYDYIGDSATVTVHINRIREKIENEPANPRYIETIWGAGYRFNFPL